MSERRALMGLVRAAADDWMARDPRPARCEVVASSRMAVLHARGQLAIGEDSSQRSIIGREFIGRLTGESTVGGPPAVLPITGRGWVTGRSQWQLDPSDVFPTGYTLGDIWAPESA